MTEGTVTIVAGLSVRVFLGTYTEYEEGVPAFIICFEMSFKVYWFKNELCGLLKYWLRWLCSFDFRGLRCVLLDGRAISSGCGPPEVIQGLIM